jgi:hypothetical protein
MYVVLECSNPLICRPLLRALWKSVLLTPASPTTTVGAHQVFFKKLFCQIGAASNVQ